MSEDEASGNGSSESRSERFGWGEGRGRSNTYRGREGYGRGGYGRGGRGGTPTGVRNPRNVARFSGGSADMMGYVFELNGEQQKRGQFKDTLDMMRIYTSKNMQK